PGRVAENASDLAAHRDGPLHPRDILRAALAQVLLQQFAPPGCRARLRHEGPELGIVQRDPVAAVGALESVNERLRQLVQLLTAPDDAVIPSRQSRLER